VQYLSQQLGWDISLGTGKRSASELHIQDPVRVADSHVWQFEGAEGGSYVKALEDMAQKAKVQQTPRANPAPHAKRTKLSST